MLRHESRVVRTVHSRIQLHASELFCRAIVAAHGHACSDYLFKLLLIGDSGVGKSCLLLRFAVRPRASLACV